MRCESCVKIKGMKKGQVNQEALDIYIEDNTYESMKGHVLFLENLITARTLVKRNKVLKCESTAVVISNFRATKEEMQFSNNTLSNVYHNHTVWIIGSSVIMESNLIQASSGGVTLILNPVNHKFREDLFESNKDLILRDTLNIASSYAGGSQPNNHLSVNISLLVGDNPSSQTHPFFPCRVVLRANTFKELSQFGLCIQNCSHSSSIKVEDCNFVNVAEPLIINEREVMGSRINSRNLLPGDNSELVAPSLCATPRQQSPSGKGTIVIKGNRFEGSELAIVKKHLSSNLYDIGNSHQPLNKK